MCDEIDVEWVAGYYRTAKAFLSYYLHGGTSKITERLAKQGAEDDFETLCPDGLQFRIASMAALHTHVPGLRAANVAQLCQLLQPYLHRLNMMRKRKSLILE